MKVDHEIRDPIHVFVRLSSDERRVVDSRPFQRLRHIHQLALTYLVYPGATHRRFEHSLGAMELAGRVYEVITRNPSDEVRNAFSECLKDQFGHAYKYEYWNLVLRMAALVHDVGHLPFSHGAEQKLLPNGTSHESLTKLLIESDEMKSIWKEIRIHAEDVCKLALGPKKLPEVEFSAWETILSDIIVGDAFGVDRMDYLLRDSYHTGVAYGKFDLYRLVDTLRILPVPPSDKEEKNSSHHFALGVEHGGLQSAEALNLARYFMYSQVYFHPIRRIYDIHLQDFLKEWLADEGYPLDVDGHLQLTDTEVLAAMREADRDPSKPGHIHARRIIRREHFKKVYSPTPDDIKVNPEASRAVYEALCAEFGDECFRHDYNLSGEGSRNFPVDIGQEIVSSLAISDPLKQLPSANVDYVFTDRKLYEEAKRWVKDHKEEVIKPKGERESNG